ncbi:NAD(P)/FAD-dependent oxidoreductase [Oceanobacillus jeddahense]|uniref:NAD(P)/FAD-dependent oxidoreductase n=1 Tax=Oceanobacillus jeddahense TaxID=1462527 RepID=UPI0005960299|nr:FAD-dependent oxidoreductase [Oceanobacillus jeddahense]
MDHFDTIIIGAGPAGLTAAQVLQEKQNVLLIDEYYHYGGRLLGQLYEETKGEWWNGMEVARKLYNEVSEKVNFKLGTSVYNVEHSNQGFDIYTTSGHFRSEHLIVATGGKEKSTPLPGWDLPGVMTVGAAQVLTNFQRVKPGNKGVIIGINPLSMVIALELGYAYVDVAKICLPPVNLINKATPKEALETLISLGNSAPSKFFSTGSKIAGKVTPLQQLVLQLFPKKGVRALGLPISIKERVMRINGQHEVESVTIQKTNASGELIEGTEKEIACDFVCISDGLSPVNEVTSLLNLKHIYMESLGGYVPLHNETMETEIENLYVAGNITGIENAKIAMLQGKMAANQIIKDTISSKKTLEAITYERQHAKVTFHKDLHQGRKNLQSMWKQFL